MNDESSLYREDLSLQPDDPLNVRGSARGRALPPSRNDPPQVFVKRLSGAEFGWEHRVFGAIVVAEGQNTYATAQLAREAGEIALGASAPNPFAPSRAG